MDFINKIGQRNTAKLIFFFSIVICSLGMFLETKNIEINKLIIGVLLFSLPNFIYLIIANKSKEYRSLSLIISATLLLVNTTFFFIQYKVILYIALIIQIVISLIYLFFVLKYKAENKK